MYCKNCGEVLELGQAICSKCGTPVVGAEINKTKKEEVKQEEKEVKLNTTKVTKKKLKKGPVISLIIIFIGFFAIIAFWDKLTYLVSTSKTTTTTVEQTTKPQVEKENETFELINTREILLENQTDKIVINYYKDEVIEPSSSNVVRTILFNDKELVKNEVIASSIEEYTTSSMFENDSNNFKTYKLMDINGVDFYTVLLYKLKLSTGEYNYNLLLVNNNGIALLDKSIIVCNRGVYLEANNREELGDRTIREDNLIYTAYKNEQYMESPMDILNNELRILMFSDEDNIVAKEIKYIVNNGELINEVIQTYDTSSILIREYGEKTNTIE